jgi:hypothetical protein
MNDAFVVNTSQIRVPSQRAVRAGEKRKKNHNTNAESWQLASFRVGLKIS